MFREILKFLPSLLSILFISFFGSGFDFVFASSDGEAEAKIFRDMVDSILFGIDSNSSSGSSSPSSLSRSSSEVSLDPDIKKLLPPPLPYEGLHPALAALSFVVTAGVLCYLLYRMSESDKAYKAAKKAAREEQELKLKIAIEKAELTELVNKVNNANSPRPVFKLYSVNEKSLLDQLADFIEYIF